MTEPFWKRPFDLTLALVGLILSAPLWALISLAIWVDDGRPIFYFQERVGRAGARFTIFKFRSMIRDAEAAHGPIAATERDPRITRVGLLLRQSAMDELPQLINIVAGDMSFVGPRADRSWEDTADQKGFLRLVRRGQGITDPSAPTLGDTPDFLQLIPNYAERLAIRPGLTGLAQIYGGYDTPRRRKLRFDRLYISRMNLWLDTRLIALSVWITLRRKWESRAKKF